MDYLKVNQDAWNQRTNIHVTSEFYDVNGFLDGKTSLKDIELAELSDVSGKSLLHLQCHFGLDTLSWARLGARVTGVDLSTTAINYARELSEQSAQHAEFICTDVYSFGENSHAQYDIVFTSYGALCWLPDINRWAKVVADHLKAGGTFFIAEFHPYYDLHVGYNYFHQDEPDIEQQGTYTENTDANEHTLMTWAHPLGDVISALINAGIEIKQLKEYPYSPYNCFDGMKEEEPGKFIIRSKDGNPIPLVYSITGIKK